MRRRIPLYVLTAALLGGAAYLHSALVAIAIVALWGVQAAEDVLTRKNKDADIAELQSVVAAQSKRMELLSHDIRNVQERAKVILGSDY